MSGITVDDRAWRGTFPHRVSPLQDEWLPGLLLRCDEANGWLSGTTASLIRLPYKREHLTNERYYFFAAHLDIHKLAQLLALSQSTLLKTTFRSDLRYDPQAPEAMPSILERSFAFQVCPICINEKRLISRFTALPDIKHCPIHQIVLRRYCVCGDGLRLFERERAPFTCGKCQRDWANLPSILPDPAQLKIEQEYLELYKLYLYENPRYFDLRLLDLFYEERNFPWLLARFHPEQWLTKRMELFPPYSIPYLFRQLVGMGFSAYQIRLHVIPSSDYGRICLNGACPMFALRNADNLAPYGYYPESGKGRVPIRYCKVCGSCFVRNRVCLTFDRDCISNDSHILYPLPRSIELAQEYLKDWKGKLEKVCHRRIKRGKMTSNWRESTHPYEPLFAEAGIPWKPYFLVDRLGLLQIIEKYIADQQ